MVHFLGLEDFGIYNLLAGIVVMLAFLKATMASASQRFLSVDLGKNNYAHTKELFYLLFIIHLIFAFFLTVTIDVVGTILVQNALNIPQYKIGVSIVVIHLMALSTGVTILCVPYDALLISRENILYISIFLILESLFNILAIYILSFFEESSRLMIYSSETVIISLVVFLIRIAYNKRYPETKFHYHLIKDWSLMKEISKYMSWNMISSLFVMARNQGFSIAFNIFGGVLVNSAYGIANQVNALVSYATEAMMQPLRPQITKIESSGNHTQSMTMVLFSTKMILALVTIIIIPLIVNMDYILEIWLDEIPQYSVSFCNILLLSAYGYSFSICLKALVEATGQVKNLFVIIGYFHLLSLVIALLLLMFGYGMVWAYSIVAVEEFIGSCYRIFLAKKIVGLNPLMYIRKIAIPSLGCFFLLLVLLLFVKEYVGNFTYLLVALLITILFVITIFYLFIFDTTEKGFILSIIKRISGQLRR